MSQLYYITGFMGSGKTTIGQALAKELEYNVVDTDQWIEEKMGLKISEIFQEKGEAYFRELETSALKEIEGSHMIITTGGGIVVNDINRQIMSSKGKIVYLQADLNELLRRLEGDQSRPLLQHKDRERIQHLYDSRLGFYEQADVIINTKGRTIAEIVTQLKTIMKS
ncbi:shikimate kinase [Halalkalibacter wakoensis]|nr:shikimate kinase [Halalkalibacter wakoensis]